MAEHERVVRVKSWSELPEILEPGEYYINGRKYTIKATVSKKAVKDAIMRAKKKGVRI